MAYQKYFTVIYLIFRLHTVGS